MTDEPDLPLHRLKTFLTQMDEEQLDDLMSDSVSSASYYMLLLWILSMVYNYDEEYPVLRVPKKIHKKAVTAYEALIRLLMLEHKGDESTKDVKHGFRKRHAANNVANVIKKYYNHLHDKR